MRNHCCINACTPSTQQQSPQLHKHTFQLNCSKNINSFSFYVCHIIQKRKAIEWICYSITRNREKPKESNKTSLVSLRCIWLMNNNYMSKMYRMERKIYAEASYKKESSPDRVKPDTIYISPAKSMKGEIYRKFLEEKGKKYLCPPITNSPQI